MANPYLRGRQYKNDGSVLHQIFVHETTEYLEVFLGNLLLNEQNELKNRNLHISGLLNEEKVDIQSEKVDIESMISAKDNEFSVKTMVHIHRLFDGVGFDGIFGRSAVMELLELKSSGASKLLSNLVQADIIEPVTGHGKGRYKFKKKISYVALQSLCIEWYLKTVISLCEEG